ncbi:hypothetical protein XENOCAPTIV_014377 [Xenoophorus captivus]|uniref:Uncharacterized protein n=1 Tax=Xenoophorus captivus TaxID=1517983 RepID=A0ABV0R8P3_9TELE
MENNADFGCNKIKEESGQLYGFSDWLIKDEKSVNNYCHWAVIDEVVGAQKAQKPGQEVFLSTMDTIKLLIQTLVLEKLLPWERKTGSYTSKRCFQT